MTKCRVVLLFLCLLFLCACGRSDGGYERGYAAGYEAGYQMALEHLTREIVEPEPTYRTIWPTYTPLPTITPIPTIKPYSPAPAATPRATVAATPKPSAAPSTDSSMTVYVSRSFTIHKKSNCSGMIYYTEMSLSQALSFGYKKCSKCWK